METEKPLFEPNPKGLIESNSHVDWENTKPLDRLMNMPVMEMLRSLKITDCYSNSLHEN